MLFEDLLKQYKTDQDEEKLQRNVRALVKEMTLKEKIYMLSGHTLWQTQRDMIRTKRNYNVNALRAGGCKRLGVPPVYFTDGPRGVVMNNSTCFPVSMLRASTFDRDLEYRFGKAIADESLAQGANYYAGVCINLVRNPKWGRSQETYGEDPYLLGEFGSTLTRSVQEEGMIACPKHFALNSIEDLRFFIDVDCDDKTLHEVYLPHFKKCIDAGALSIMGAYNKFQGEYCCGNKGLLTDILRKEWGFKGFVMSDFVNGVHDAEASLNAGLNMEMMFTMHYNPLKIRSLLKKGKVKEEQLDVLNEEIVRALVIATSKQTPRSKDVIASKEHRALAKEIAEKGMVLLENNGILPLKEGEEVRLVGEYAEGVNVGDHGSSRVYDPHIVTPKEGLAKVFKLKDDAKISVICVGNNYKEEGEYFASANEKLNEKPKDSGGDRTSLSLKEEEIALIRSEKAKGNKVIVVLFGGCAIMTEDWREDADAIVMNYYSGCEGGNALADLLCGNANFSGKLPYTVAKDEKDYPAIIGIGQRPYRLTYGYYHGYTLFDHEKKEVRYPFGYGLSYTDFKIGKCDVENKENKIVLSVPVSNIGKMDGAEVVEVYVSSKKEGRPVKLLKGFARVEVKAGETATAQIKIDKDELRFYDEGKWVLDEHYDIYVGNSVNNVKKVAEI